MSWLSALSSASSPLCAPSPLPAEAAAGAGSVSSAHSRSYSGLLGVSTVHTLPWTSCGSSMTRRRPSASMTQGSSAATARRMTSAATDCSVGSRPRPGPTTMPVKAGNHLEMASA
eukprot:6195341-Pleurochrysis_carterae.AAC.1